MAAATIPREILLEILSNVDGRTLTQCTYVCKSWNRLASESLFKELCLDTCHVYKVKHILEGAPNNPIYFKHCANVKKLTLKNTNRANFYARLEKSTIDPIYAFTQEQLITLLEYMPNLQTLYLETFHREKYLEFILKSDSKQCLNHIQAIVSTQSCTYSSAYRSEFYFPVCYKYRATLIELDLEDLYSGYHYDKTLTLLSHFISLKTLCLRNPLDESLTIADLLKASPNLVTLDIDRRVHIFRPSASTAPSYYLNQNISKNTVIKKLVLAMPSVPKGEIIYINDCLSTQLQHLIVDLDTDLNEWIGIVGIENVLKLVKRMGTMKQSALTFGSRTQPIQSNMTNYFKVFSAFKQDNLTCTAVYGKKSALRNKSLFEYGLQKCDYYRQTEDGQRVIEIALPDTSYSTIGPKNFNGLTIELNEPDSELAPAFLKYAMVNCPGLWRYDYINSANSHRIRIQVRRNPAQPYVIGDFTNEKEMLTVLATGSVIPSKLIMDQIAFCLPHIEIYSVSEASYRWLNNVNHPVDTTAFKNLKRFYLDLGRFYVGVHIEYTDGDKTHYLFEDSYQTLKETSSNDQERSFDNQIMDRIFTAKIICSKEITLVFRHTKNVVVAEIQNGQLRDYISKSTDYNNKCFMLEKKNYTYSR